MHTTHERKLERKKVSNRVFRHDMIWSLTALNALTIGLVDDIPGMTGVALSVALSVSYITLLLYVTRKSRKKVQNAIEDLEMLAEVEGYLSNSVGSQKSIGGGRG